MPPNLNKQKGEKQMTHSTDPILTIHETHIVLPSGRQIALDARKRFEPNTSIAYAIQQQKQ